MCAIAVAWELINSSGLGWGSATTGAWHQVAHSVVKYGGNPLSNPFGSPGNPSYPSFFHPLNQIKGFGINFRATTAAISYPMVIFPDTYQIISKLSTLL